MRATRITSIKKSCILQLSVYNGFKYPPVPNNWKNYLQDLVAERLTSPRIPFMKIRRLRHIHGQIGIYGQVINVPVKFDSMIGKLPGMFILTIVYTYT